MGILFLPLPSPINAGMDLNMGIEYPAAGILVGPLRPCQRSILDVGFRSPHRQQYAVKESDSLQNYRETCRGTGSLRKKTSGLGERMRKDN
jgi:hypothetical protein